MATHTNFAKVAKKANKAARRSVKSYGKRLKREAKIARKGMDKVHTELSFNQKSGFYGVVLLGAVILSAVIGRASKRS